VNLNDSIYAVSLMRCIHAFRHVSILNRWGLQTEGLGSWGEGEAGFYIHENDFRQPIITVIREFLYSEVIQPALGELFHSKAWIFQACMRQNVNAWCKEICTLVSRELINGVSVK
jgi:hypothetical protein